MKDIEQLKKYLDDLVKLETEKYRLEEIKKTLVNFGIQKENEVNSPNINKEKLEIELNSKFDNLEKEIELQKEKINSSKLEFNRLIMSFCSFGLLFCIASAMYMLILGIIFGDDGISAAIVLALITTIILYIISKFKEKEKCDEEKNVLYDLEATLNEKKEKIKLEYDVLIEKSIDDYNVNKNKLIILCNNNSQNLVKLDELYKYIVSKLNDFYNLNIIFEKYRNLSAVTMFFEYFASSRVFELEGKDGAYNLYELELRQNLIINNLTQINDNLEKIKDNQYCLYKELSNVNSSLKVIDDSLTNLVDIEKYNAVVNLEIAKNTAMMKNIQLYNFIME